jgi:regulator of cell morphogenesis and NO signaling
MTDIQTRTLGDLVASNPAAVRVFEPLGLDYCCHGNRTLAEACSAAGIDAWAVAGALADLEDEAGARWTTLDAPALARHIFDTHHRYLHEELPLLHALATKVLTVHGERHPELAEVVRLVVELRADLEPHMMKEERVLFPAIDSLVGGRTEFPFGSVANPVRMMMMEHDRAGELLSKLRAATGGYVVPDDACASYRSLYERLEALELDTHLHIHKENHTLFPAVLELAGRWTTDAGRATVSAG